MANELLGRIEEWRRKLLDLTNRNQLVSCKIGPRAAIRLEDPSPGAVWNGLLGGADLTFAWKRELVPDANESGDENNPAPQSSLFAFPRLLNVIVRKGEAPVEPQATSDFPRAHGSAEASPSLFQQAAKVEGPPPVEPRITLEQCLESRGVQLAIGG
jgi:hypothetical protein